MNIISHMTEAGLSGQAIDALFIAGSTSIIALAIAIIMAPMHIRNLKGAKIRLFTKVLRIENILLDQEVRRLDGEELTGAYKEMRDDQRPKADEQDSKVK